MNKAQQPKWLQTFVDNYERLAVDNLELIQNIYHPNVEFQDPAHTLVGLAKLEAYFASLYTNLSSCQFVINKVLVDNDEAAVYWQMNFTHPKLSNGNTIVVEGTSLLKGQGDKVIAHRDYVDFGAMLYEHIPLLGSAVRYVKNRLAA